MPTLESVRGESFPWGLVVGGFAGLGVVLYIAVKRAERKKKI
jgi:F0F1-type ATP synthase assembly protein I